MRWTTLLQGAPLVVSLALSTSVAAADPSDEEEPPTENAEENAAVLAGIRTNPSVGYGVGGAVAPRGVATLELRASKRMWWLLRASATYTTSGNESGDQRFDTRSFGVLGGTGFRIVVNPESTVRFSPVLLVGGGYGRTNFGDAQQKSDSWHMGATAGVMLDVPLAPGFGIRMSTDLVAAGYARSVLRIDDNRSSSHGWSAGLTFNPSLEARFVF